jgi:hypothetical protein
MVLALAGDSTITRCFPAVDPADFVDFPTLVALTVFADLVVFADLAAVLRFGAFFPGDVFFEDSFGVGTAVVFLVVSAM